MRRSLAAGLLLALGSGCGESDEFDLAPGTPGPLKLPECGRGDYRPCDVRDESCRIEKLALAACLRGDEPGELPKVSIMTAAEYDAYLVETYPRPNPDHWGSVYEMLGFVEPGGLDAKRLMRRGPRDVAGFYRWEEDDIVLIDRDLSLDGLDMNLVLVHEFVHALQDREVDLHAYAEAHAEDDDSFLAARSVYEGEARMLEDRLRAAMAGLDVDAVDWELRTDSLVSYGEKWMFEQPSPLLAASEIVPYAHGARYLYPRWRDAGHEAVLSLYANPPASTKVLLLGQEEAAAEVAAFPELEPPTGVEHFATSSLGALGLYVYLAGTLSLEEAREAALSWRYDRFDIYLDAETATPIVVWSVEASEEALSALVRRTNGLVANATSRRSGERLRLAATMAESSLMWAVESEL